MKLDSQDLLATTAIALGTGQLLVHMLEVHNSKDLSSYSYPSLLIGIVGSLLWTLYQVKKGANYSAVYSSFGLVIQLYILRKVMVSRKKKKTFVITR